MKPFFHIPVFLLSCGIYAHAQYPIAPPPVLPGTAQPGAAASTQTIEELTTSKDWQNPAALRDKLSKKILAKLNSTDESAIRNFLKSESNRLLLANWQLSNAEILSEKAYEDYRKSLEKKQGDKKRELANREKELPLLGGTAVESTEYAIEKLKGEIAELEAELAQPMRMADVVKRPRASRLIGLIANDLGWIGDVVYSGECIMPGRMLNMLANMMERYTRMLPNDRLPRDIATATALEFARSGWTVDNACKRAEYFVRNWRQDRLHAGFDTLPFWMRRVVCGWKGDHSSGTPESFTWALYNVNLPDDRYTGCCWRCGYVLHNVYGESVHGSAYYNAFEGMYTGRHHEFTQDVGGVCGSLSHFGASAACAHGIPGLTMGEPGHCAYAVWVNGKWTPAYSLTWERGIHWRPWFNNNCYSSLQLTTDLYSGAQKQTTRLSNAYRVLGQLYAAKGNTGTASTCFLKAAEVQPINYPVYVEHASLLANTKASMDAWMQLNSSICTRLTPIYAECASNLVRKYVYDNMLKHGASAEQLESAFDAFWQNTRDLGPDRWKLQELLDKQISTLNDVRKNSNMDNTCAALRSMLAGTSGKQAYVTYAMESGNNLMQKMDENGKSRVLNIMTEALGNGGKLDDETRTGVLSKIILAAESNRDAGAFQAVSKMIDPAKSHENRPIGDFEPFPGKLVSEGGVIFASSTSQWDKPATHASVLTRQGGQIHTAKDKSPWVGVKLPKHASISGVVVAAHSNRSNWNRLNHLQIQVSETGKDDDWHNVGQMSGKCTQRLLRFDLSAEMPKALYVRVIRPDCDNVFHIDGIFVYGTPAA